MFCKVRVEGVLDPLGVCHTHTTGKSITATLTVIPGLDVVVAQAEVVVAVAPGVL